MNISPRRLSPSPAVTGETSPDVLVGRRREIGLVRSWLDEARDGQGRVAVCVGEPGVGKTRLAREVSGLALAVGTAVAWGRCPGTGTAPVLWPWRQVLRSLGVQPSALLASQDESRDARYRVSEELAEAVGQVAGVGGLVVILDDLQWLDEPSFLVLRTLADQISGMRLFLFVTHSSADPSGAASRLLPELLRSPHAERLELRPLDVAGVRELLRAIGVTDADEQATAVFELTGGNPFFVREVARAMADGTWRPDRPPPTVIDMTEARLRRLSSGCRRLMHAAAVIGRDFPVRLAAAVLDVPVLECLTLVDEAVARGFLDRASDSGDYRFVHALTCNAVTATLTTADAAALHRAVAEVTAADVSGGDPSDHLFDIARHWAFLAPLGEAGTAARWALRAADEAVRRTAYETAVQLYRSAVDLDRQMPARERAAVLLALGRAAYLAGDIPTCVRTAVDAATTAQQAHDPQLLAEAALVAEPTPDAEVNATIGRLCDQAREALQPGEHAALCARVVAQQSHLAFYDGDASATARLSTHALALARQADDDSGLMSALHARQEACPGAAGRAQRLQLADEMAALGRRSDNPRALLSAALWRFEALLEEGLLTAASQQIPVLDLAARRIGGPVAAWHADRAAACIAQAQGRFDDARALGRRAYERMRRLEPRSAAGTYFALCCALSMHIGVTEEAAELLDTLYQPPARFATMSRLSRAHLLLRAGRPDEATACYEQAGPVDTWSLPVFFVVPAHVYAVLVAMALDRHADLDLLLGRLDAHRHEHAAGGGVVYLGPVALTLGRGAAAVGRLDEAIDNLTQAVRLAERVGAPGFAAQAHHHLAETLLSRAALGDHRRAENAAATARRLVRALGMTAYGNSSDDLASRIARERDRGLSRRELEVAALVAEGLTNREIGERLVLSERTAQNHVQHILAKLQFSNRSQIAVWMASRRS